MRNALSHGDKVTAVGRTLENTLEQMKDWHERCLGLLCDVRVRESVGAVIESTIKRWGGIDIIVKYVQSQSTFALPPMLPRTEAELRRNVIAAALATVL